MAESITALVNDTLPSGTTLTTAEVLDYIDVGRSPGGSEVSFPTVQCLNHSPGVALALQSLRHLDQDWTCQHTAHLALEASSPALHHGAQTMS